MEHTGFHPKMENTVPLELEKAGSHCIVLAFFFLFSYKQTVSHLLQVFAAFVIVT